MIRQQRINVHQNEFEKRKHSIEEKEEEEEELLSCYNHAHYDSESPTPKLYNNNPEKKSMDLPAEIHILASGPSLGLIGLDDTNPSSSLCLARCVVPLQRFALQTVHPLCFQVFGEFFGTFLMVFMLTCINSASLYSADSGNSTWPVAIASGFVVCLCIYAFSPLSSAHLNPAVTIALLLFRPEPRHNLLRAFLYIPSQIIGAFVGAALTYALWYVFNPNNYSIPFHIIFSKYTHSIIIFILILFFFKLTIIYKYKYNI